MVWPFRHKQKPWWTDTAQWVAGLPDLVTVRACPACEFPLFFYTLQQTKDGWDHEYPVVREFPPWARAMKLTCQRCEHVTWTKPLNWEPEFSIGPFTKRGPFWKWSPLKPWWTDTAQWVSKLPDVRVSQFCPACGSRQLEHLLIQTETRWGLSLPITRDLPRAAWHIRWLCTRCRCFGFAQSANRGPAAVADGPERDARRTA